MFHVRGAKDMDPARGVHTRRPKANTGQMDPLYDETHGSLDGTMLQYAKSEIGRFPEMRQEKIQRLRQALQDGTYRVSNHQIALAMLSDLLGQHGKPLPPWGSVGEIFRDGAFHSAN